MRFTRGTAGSLAGFGAVALALTVGGSPAAAALGGTAGWTEVSTGQVAVMSLGQPSASLTWAGGAEVTKDASGVTTFLPTLFARDTKAGGGWQQVKLKGAGSWDSRVNDISTNADGSAFFVGDQGTSDGQGVLVGRYTGGAWKLTDDTGLPTGTIDASLLSVSSVSGQDAWAVGQGYTDSGFTQIPVVQHWNGSKWSSVKIPGSANWSLNQVDEVAPDDVWVVGVDESTGQSLAVHWNGHKWTRTSTPTYGDTGILFDVTARSADDVWAVGWSTDTDKQRPAGVALHWNGTAWTQVPLPDGTFSLQSVTLLPAGGIAVVGGNDDRTVGLSWSRAGGWTSLGLPDSDAQLPLGAGAVINSGDHLTVAGWHYVRSDAGDSFDHGVLLTD